MSKQVTSPLRRSNSRIDTPDGVWVIWRCSGREMTSTVWNLGPGGLFVETSTPRLVGSKADVIFLVPEGEINAEAVVRHVQSGRGVGLKFTAIRDADRARMVALLKRLRSLSP